MVVVVVGCDKLAAVRVASSTMIMASAGTPAYGRMSGKWSAAGCCTLAPLAVRAAGGWPSTRRSLSQCHPTTEAGCCTLAPLAVRAAGGWPSTRRSLSQCHPTTEAVCCNTGSARGSCCWRLAEYSTLAQPVPPSHPARYYSYSYSPAPQAGPSADNSAPVGRGAERYEEE